MRDVRFRPATVEDFTFLATMLGEAAVWRPDKPTPTGDQVLADPRYAMYLAGWPRQGADSQILPLAGTENEKWETGRRTRVDFTRATLYASRRQSGVTATALGKISTCAPRPGWTTSIT